MNRLQSLVLGAGLLLSAAAHALEYPIGTPHNVAGMEVAAVYLQPIDMEPEGHMRKASETDIHLEADIHALANNPNGIPEGFWVPHILVKYELIKAGHERGHQGRHDADGRQRRPALRRQRQAQGPGQVQGQFIIYPPNARENPAGNMFGRHTDRATGVRPWFKTVEVEWEFTFAGIGKKGGY